MKTSRKNYAKKNQNLTTIAVSACLLGYKCRYDGKSKQDAVLVRYLKSEKILPICPEQLGGLSTPRDPSEIQSGNGFDVIDGKSRVVNIYGIDNTEAFIKGAYIAMEQLKICNIRHCILKYKSPSCGIAIKQNCNAEKSKFITGVTAALLIRNGFYVTAR